MPADDFDDDDGECALCGGSAVEHNHAMSDCPGALTPAQLAHLPTYARSWLRDPSAPSSEDKSELAETDRAASHFARGVLMLVAENERLRAERSPLRPLTEAEIVAALHEGHAESRAATGDNAWTSLLRQRDEVRAALATVEKERDVLRAALRWTLDEIEHAWPYAGDYFQDKHRDVAHENELRAQLAMERVAIRHVDGPNAKEHPDE